MWGKLKEQFNILKLEKKRLYLVTNSDKFLSKDEFLDAIASALQGGVDIIQLNEKNIPDKVLVEIGHKIRILCDEFGATFIINNRSDIAQIVGADGVHLGEYDISVADAREILGENAIIGKSAYSTDDIIKAVNEGADYAIFGPIITQNPKTDSEIDLKQINWVVKNIDMPVFLLGEITPDNINKFTSIGANKFALANSLMYAKSPEKSARAMRKYLI